MDLMQTRTIICLPWYQHALPATVKAQAVQRALQLAFQDTTQGEPRGPMRATVGQDSRRTVLVPPGYQIFAQALDSDGSFLAKLLGLQDRVPIVAQTDL